MSEPPVPMTGREGEADPVMERIQADRRPGELDSAMDSGSDEGDISATERFEGEMTPEEALEVFGASEDERTS